ncbi:MAG: hypothetical protein R2795_13955 [Saprospiraceae bacterium]
MSNGTESQEENFLQSFLQYLLYRHATFQPELANALRSGTQLQAFTTINDD